MPSIDDADLSQYQEVLALEQKHWVATEWDEPDTITVSPLSSSQPSLSQEQDSASEGDSSAEVVTRGSGNQFTNPYIKKN